MLTQDTTPSVTVLIATYNKAAALRHSIESVLWQTFRDFELLVIGDGCTDDSAEVVAAIGDPRVHWLNLPANTGYQSAPHNEGLRRAQGGYIAYLNHDDIWLPNHLQVLVERLEATGADYAYSVLEWVLGSGDGYADIPSFPDAPRPPEASATVHRRSIVTELGYWKLPHETRTLPRAEYFRRGQLSGKRFVFAPFLTVLKFCDTTTGYAAVAQQPDYMDRIRRDPDFAQQELAMLLARTIADVDQPIGVHRFPKQLGDRVRRALIRRRIDPARLGVWRAQGWRIRDWRRCHQLAAAPESRLTE